MIQKLKVLCTGVILRFESTIVGQFFGHTHHDSVEIHYDDKNVSRATK